ncbi:hypothetical protein [Anaerotruncus rubiinfantis]|uniref:hypothetical protein n=1 Tax=Anaerotruncus rubiinfantis TaxID=1720200 RepID=UPI0034A2D60A
MFTAADVVKRLQLDGVIPSSAPDAKTLAQIDDMAEKAMNYIHSDGIPDGLFRAFCKLCAAYISNCDAGSAGTGEVKSISEGDTTVTFATSTETAAMDADGIMSQYASDLNRYRSVYFRKADVPWAFQQM